MEQWYLIFDATHYYWVKKPPSRPWRIEMVLFSFNSCHIANKKAAIIDIVSEINYKWREKETILLGIQPGEDKAYFLKTI